MLRFLTIGLVTAIVAAMLHWGSGSPQRATEITRTTLDPVPVADMQDGPKTAAEIAAIIAEFKAPPPVLASNSDVETAAPENEVAAADADIVEPALVAVNLAATPAAPEPAPIETSDAALDAEFVAARFEAPAASLAVARSRLPVARPASLRRPAPASEAAPAPVSPPIPDAPAPEPARAAVTPTAVSQAVAEAMQAVEPEPVTRALAEAISDDLLYVSGTKVNLRAQPSIGAAVVSRLLKGDAAQVLDDTGDGWLHVRDVSSGDEGFMAEIFLSDASPR